MANPERVIVYIDGFNLYFGIREKKWRDVLWLDLERFASNLLKPGQTLAGVKYFTARISTPPDKVKRQQTFLEASQTLSKVQVFFGQYQMEPRKCRECGHEDKVPHEKMTDVNIATELIIDAYLDRYDVAILVSADSDLLGPIRAVRQHFGTKRIVVAFPPSRNSKRLTQEASAVFRIGLDKLTEAQLPDEVIKPDGIVLKRPDEWHATRHRKAR